MEMGRAKVVMTTALTANFGVRNEEFSKSELNNSGFTLIEVLTALTIFSIGLLGISGMLLIGEQGIAAGNKSLSAVQISRAQMEKLKGAATIESGSGECTALYSPEVQCQWTIRKDTPSEDLHNIEVKASWYEGEKKRELVLNTLRFIK